MLHVVTPEIEPDEEETEESVSVAEAARLIGCDEATVRAMLRNRELTGHKFGKGVKGKAPRGVAVHLASVRAYKRRNSLGRLPIAANDAAPAHREPVQNSRHKHTMKRLRALGML